jgi:hypothetical protein
MGKRVSNMHESTRRFNVSSRKNTKEHYLYATPTNRKPAGQFETALIDHTIKGPSKEHQHTKAKFCAIVIPKKTRKNIPKYRSQSTWESAFQHSEIEEPVE